MTQHDQPDCFELIRTVNDFLESIEGSFMGLISTVCNVQSMC